MEPTLYGPLEFKCREAYMVLTPSEIFAILDGWEWRVNHQIEWAAVWVAMLMNAGGHMKRAVHPEELLGRPLSIKGGQTK